MTRPRRKWVVFGAVVVVVVAATVTALVVTHSSSPHHGGNDLTGLYPNRPLLAHGTGNRVVRLSHVTGPVEVTLVCAGRRRVGVSGSEDGERVIGFETYCRNGIGSTSADIDRWPKKIVVYDAGRTGQWALYAGERDSVR